MRKVAIQLLLVDGPEQPPDLLFAYNEPAFPLVSSETRVAVLLNSFPSLHLLIAAVTCDENMS